MSRKEFIKIIEDNQCKRIAEVGVGHGHFSEFLLEKISSIEKLYAIDPWSDKYLEFREGSYMSTINALEKFKDRAMILRETSKDASKMFENESLDFVYIDAEHSYGAVINDLEAWYPKIKLGKILAGHDYDKSQPDVVKAVDEFIKKYNLKLNIITPSKKYDEFGEEAYSASWWVIKQ